MKNRIVHIEIAGVRGESLETFYSELFGWDIQREAIAGYPYGRIDFGKDNVLTGGIRHEPEGSSEIVIYIEVEDLAASVKRAQELGATVRIPPLASSEVTFALVVDPEGNPIGLVQGPSV